MHHSGLKGYRFWRARCLQHPALSVLWIGCEAFFLSFAIALALSEVIDQPPRDFEALPFDIQAITAIVIAPILETVLFQLLPIVVVRYIARSNRGALMISVFLFALAHAEAGPITLVCTTFGGWYFGTMFLRWLDRSLWTAYWTTALCHALVNGLATGVRAVAMWYL